MEKNIMTIKQEKLALRKKIAGLKPEDYKFLNDQVLKTGIISISYMMRKLKCTESKAKEMITAFYALT
jgi:hypothetical protein